MLSKLDIITHIIIFFFGVGIGHRLINNNIKKWTNILFALHKVKHLNEQKLVWPYKKKFNNDVFCLKSKKQYRFTLF